MRENALTTTEDLARRLARIPRVRLAWLPTPLDYCPNLSARPGWPPLWIKRDDLTGLATGGNKTRYLEYVVADAQARGADTLVISSGNQSNHCRQLAAAAARVGMKSVHLLWGSPPVELDGNLLLDTILGAELQFLNMPPGPPDPGGAGFEAALAGESPPVDRTLMHQAIQETTARLREQGRKPYCTNTDPLPGLPALGYVGCALELVDQMRQAGIRQAEVFVASGGATHAGLLLGSLLLGSPYRVTGVSYHAASAPGREERIAAMATSAAQILGYELVVSPGLVDNDARYATQPLFNGTERRWQPVIDLARAEGILLEPTYVGRAMLAIYERVEAGAWPSGRPIILIHSGGLPLLFPLGRQSLPEEYRRG